MKKKLFVGISAAALAAVMCVAFVGCGDSSAKDVKGAEVTAEQWDAALEVFGKDDAQYTVDMEMKMVYSLTADATSIGGEKKSGSVTTTSTGTYINNGAKQSGKGEGKVSVDGDYEREALLNNLGMSEEDLKDAEETTEIYAEKTESGYKVYEQNEEGNWVTQNRTGGIIPVSEYAPEGSFDDYKYDEKLQGYVDKDYKEEDTGYVVYKFNSDGQLIAIYSYSAYTQGTQVLQVTMSYETSFVISYKAGEINLPTVA